MVEVAHTLSCSAFKIATQNWLPFGGSASQLMHALLIVCVSGSKRKLTKGKS